MKSGLLTIKNLKCGGCQTTIINKVSKLKNIKDVHVNLYDSTISFKYSTIKDFENLKLELSNLGYPTLGEKNSVMKKAKSYISCAIGRL